jgi:hypothetical protein
VRGRAVAPNGVSPLSARAQAVVKPQRDRIAAETGHERRHARRVVSQIPATLSGRGMTQPIACTIRDRSSTGALLEFPPTRFGEEAPNVAVGERLTLTFNFSNERSSVVCSVVRIEGNRCGVQFCGQFHTQVSKPKRPLNDRSKTAPKGRSGLLGGLFKE